MNDAPTIDPIGNVLTDENVSTQVTLTGLSAGAANETGPLSITAESSDTNLLLNPVINYTDPNRQLMRPIVSGR